MTGRNRRAIRWRHYLGVLASLAVMDLLISAVAIIVVWSDGPAELWAGVQALARGALWAEILPLVGAVLVAQAIFLFPVRRPHIAARRQAHRQRSVRASLIIAGLACALLTTAALFAIAELFSIFEPIADLVDGPRYGAPLAIAAVILVQWVLFAILILAFVRPAQRESLLGTVAARLFLGTTLETLAIIPVDVMVRRRTDCYCATGTFCSLIMVSAAGSFALGPAIIIPLLHRRRKRCYHSRCDVCRADMRAHLNADQCPACGAGWMPPPACASSRFCRCGHDFASDFSTPACPRCATPRTLNPLVRQLLACEHCGYDMRGDLHADRCPECGADWATQSDAPPDKPN